MIDRSSNTIHTANAIFYKHVKGGCRYLLVQEDDGRWGLPGGAKDAGDNSLEDTMRRELTEELGLLNSEYQLVATDITQEFYYNLFMSSRYGKRGSVAVFLVKYVSEKNLSPNTQELMSIGWFDRESAINKLSFDYLRHVFKKGIMVLEHANSIN